ncbi:hypothetical protein [Streptomyces sp. NPDC056949]|uniref:hypothetical protein n=1 Tax=Streptomyces sp. NPDC056949 TaxID=3345976 RepID=UPI003630B418
MANRRRPVDASTPLGRFALKLRELQEDAIARAGSSDAARAISIDKVATQGPWRTSRPSIFAALNGSRLPSHDTLCAIVSAWDEDSHEARQKWLKLRSAVEAEMITTRQASPEAELQPEPEPEPEPELIRLPDPQPLDEATRSAGDSEFRGSGYVVPDVTSHIELKRALADALEKSGKTTAKIAAEADLGHTTVTQAIDPGAAPPSERTVEALAWALRVDRDTRSRLQLLRQLATIGHGKQNTGRI